MKVRGSRLDGGRAKNLQVKTRTLKTTGCGTPKKESKSTAQILTSSLFAIRHYAKRERGLIAIDSFTEGTNPRENPHPENRRVRHPNLTSLF